MAHNPRNPLYELRCLAITHFLESPANNTLFRNSKAQSDNDIFQDFWKVKSFNYLFLDHKLEALHHKFKFVPLWLKIRYLCNTATGHSTKKLVLSFRRLEQWLDLSICITYNLKRIIVIILWWWYLFGSCLLNECSELRVMLPSIPHNMWRQLPKIYHYKCKWDIQVYRRHRHITKILYAYDRHIKYYIIVCLLLSNICNI